jgi:hypothetical protein
MKPTKKTIKPTKKLTIKEMEKAILATKKWTKMQGFHLDLEDMGLGMDCGTKAFYMNKEDAKDDLLESFEECIQPGEAWIDVLPSGILGEQYWGVEHTKELYDDLKKSGIIKK